MGEFSLAHTYSEFWETPVGLSVGNMHAELTVKELVNDGLMAFFFFIVGLEVKAQFTIVSSPSGLARWFPVVAALAGLTLPALIFLLFNPSGDDARAWGVVISTDTAFLVGALAIIAPKYPARLRTFLLTLAVVDDVRCPGGDRAVLLREDPGDSPSDRRGAAGRPGQCAVSARGGPRTGVFHPGCRAGGRRCFSGECTRLWREVAVALVIPVFTPERQRVEAAVEVIRRSGSRQLGVRPGRDPAACATPSRSTSGS